MMSTEEQNFVTGFNHGYMLTKHEPGLVAKITATVTPVSDYLDGFFSGKEEWELEHRRERLNELENIRNRSKDKERDLDKE